MTQELVKGFKRFADEHYPEGDPDTLMQILVRNGQKPEYLIVSCIDSRADPAILFGTPPGSFISFRAPGGIVRPYSEGTALGASLAFGINKLKTPTLIVLGHTQCGAMEGLVKGVDDPDVRSFVEVAQRSLRRAELKQAFSGCSCPHELQRATERESVLQSLENLMTYDSVSTAVRDGKLQIKAWLFDMENGKLLEYDPQQGEFFDVLLHPQIIEAAPDAEINDGLHAT